MERFEHEKHSFLRTEKILFGTISSDRNICDIFRMFRSPRFQIYKYHFCAMICCRDIGPWNHSKWRKIERLERFMTCNISATKCPTRMILIYLESGLPEYSKYITKIPVRWDCFKKNFFGSLKRMFFTLKTFHLINF